ncbi:Uncharacterized protein FWK35_00021965 [Aphis craccivora]|uniref:Ig-like domain-containing protein n=1 Tax=Aphis craccivora TaxID=307492 RepID=A0A6G0YXR3_APHCR|nr:Uncharacterized protein FWK35_00021965 [Aphis craccivora]
MRLSYATGRPEPKVRWWRGETLMDTGNEGISGQFTASSSKVKQNEITIEALGRYDQGAVYTCQASNSNLSAPVSASVTIEMYRAITEYVQNVSGYCTEYVIGS